jgi:RNA polymerase sigma-70 factor (ECF subfamily)
MSGGVEPVHLRPRLHAGSLSRDSLASRCAAVVRGLSNGEMPVAQPLTDDVVVAGCAGDAAAFRTIYRELAPIVFGYLRARGVSDPEAVTSDVFLSVLPRMGELTGGVAGLRTFVMSVAHARMVDDARRRRRAPHVSEYDVMLDPRVAESAENEAIGSIATAGIVRLLQTLPDDQREVLALRFIADLSVDAVAGIIGRSPGAVKQLQRRGLITLRRMMAEPGVTR